MKKFYLLIISITIIIFSVYYYNTLSNKIIEKDEPFTGKTPFNNNFISNTIDADYINKKTKDLYELQIKLNKLREHLYKFPLDDILQVNPKVINNSQKFSVKINSTNNFNNIYTIEIPTGEQGPQGQIGDSGDDGDKGESGEKGPSGNCGFLFK